MAKPASHLDWAVGNSDPSTNVIEPSPAKKVSAFSADERPAYEFFNWMFFRQDEWNKYFEAQTDTFQSRYSVIIGTGVDATHATLAAAVADGAVGVDQWVLIRDSLAVTTAISLTKARWRIDFAPGVVYSKSGATIGLSLEAEGIEINNGRFTGFTAGGDIAITQLVGAEYCKVSGTRFGPSTDTEVDQSAVPAGKIGPVSNTITEI